MMKVAELLGRAEHGDAEATRRILMTGGHAHRFPDGLPAGVPVVTPDFEATEKQLSRQYQMIPATGRIGIRASTMLSFATSRNDEASAHDLIVALHQRGAALRLAGDARRRARLRHVASPALRPARHHRRPRRQRHAGGRARVSSSRDGPEPPARPGGPREAAGRTAHLGGLDAAHVARRSSPCEYGCHLAAPAETVVSSMTAVGLVVPMVVGMHGVRP